MIQRSRTLLYRTWTALALLALLVPGVTRAAPKFVPGEVLVRSPFVSLGVGVLVACIADEHGRCAVALPTAPRARP